MHCGQSEMCRAQQWFPNHSSGVCFGCTWFLCWEWGEGLDLGPFPNSPSSNLCFDGKETGGQGSECSSTLHVELFRLAWNFWSIPMSPALLGLPCEAILCYSATEEIIFIVLRLGFSVSAALSLPPVGEILSVNSVPTNVTTSCCTLILVALLP